MFQILRSHLLESADENSPPGVNGFNGNGGRTREQIKQFSCHGWIESVGFSVIHEPPYTNRTCGGVGGRGLESPLLPNSRNPSSIRTRLEQGPIGNAGGTFRW